MRHFTLASLTAAAFAVGLLASAPSMAQSTQPAAKADKMAPAPKAAMTRTSTWAAALASCRPAAGRGRVAPLVATRSPSGRVG